MNDAIQPPDTHNDAVDDPDSNPEVYSLERDESLNAIEDLSDESPPGRQSADVLSEITVAGPLGHGALKIVLYNCAWVIVAGSAAAVAFLLGFRDIWVTMAVLATFVMLAIIAAFIRSRFVARRVVRFLVENVVLVVGGENQALFELATRRFRWFARLETIETLASTLAKLQGFSGTIRIGQLSRQHAIAPINVPFEPRPIDMLGAWDLEGIPQLSGDPRSATLSTSPREHSAGTVTWFLQSHWASVLLSLVFWIPGLLAFIRSGRPGLGFLLVSTWLFRSVQKAFSEKSHVSEGGVGQGYIVPGGLIFRSTFGAHRESTDRAAKFLHLFDRRKSVLCVTQKTLTRWSAVVADADREVKLDMNELDTNRLLAAWLSPLPPPEVSRLSDMA